jgi:ElaB/YqjD/DUF883 family membrane-anchored ribosome-binding protein
MADAAAKTTKPRAPKKSAAKKNTAPAAPRSNTELAKSRFNAALDEAKAGAAALTAEARSRGSSYTTQARKSGDDYAAQAKTKAAELARDGKSKASDALSTLGQTVADNAGTIDDRFGTKYGDYARTASRSLQETAAKLDSKSVEELGEDAREMVRRNPGAAVGIAAIVGFFFARLFRK